MSRKPSRRGSPRKRQGARRGKRGRASGRRRVGTARRQALLVLAALTIPAGLLLSVRRTADGTRLAERLAELRRETMLLEEALVDEVVRVDSLTSRERIARIAGEYALRQAEDHEVVILGELSGAQPGGEGP